MLSMGFVSLILHVASRWMGIRPFRYGTWLIQACIGSLGIVFAFAAWALEHAYFFPGTFSLLERGSCIRWRIPKALSDLEGRRISISIWGRCHFSSSLIRSLCKYLGSIWLK